LHVCDVSDYRRDAKGTEEKQKNLCAFCSLRVKF
jgi:hypothetical protein